MDGSGIPIDPNRSHTDDTNYSPNPSPSLLQSVSGNASSSGSPCGSRRYGSIGEKEKKNREERLKLVKERQEQEHEKRIAELKAAVEKETKIRQLKDAERLRRIQEIKMKETFRRQAVEERRRRLETEDKEKREQILAKYKEYEHKLMSQRDQKKPIYAFGSSTPRTLAYLEHLDNSMRVYNSRLGSASGADEESAATSGKAASPAEKRATSACSLARKPLTASSSPNLSPQHLQVQRSKAVGGASNSRYQPSSRSTKPVLSPSGRWGGSMVASMYGGGVALSTTNARAGVPERDPLANVHSMTTSFAVGETSGMHAKNVRTKGPITSPTSARSQSTTRLARSAVSPRKTRQRDIIAEESEDGTDIAHMDNHKSAVSKQLGSNGTGDGATTAAASSQKARAVSSARTPSAPPTARRSIAEANPKSTAAPSPAAKEKFKAPAPPKGAAKKPPQQPTTDASVPKIIRKPKPTPETSTSENATVLVPEDDGLCNDVSDSSTPAAVSAQAMVEQFLPPSSPANHPSPVVDRLSLENDHLFQQHRVDFAPHDDHSESINSDVGNQFSNAPVEHHVEHQPTEEVGEDHDSIALANELVPGVPKPSGQGVGKVLSQEEAAAALAERRRVAREQLEKEKELERQREEQLRLEEEEMRRREEEEFRRQEQEELRVLEEARRVEEERMRRMIEEEEQRREAEEKQRAEEQRKKAEAEAKAREEAERAERERKEAEEKFRKDELERSERKKRLDAIMQRTRQSGAAGPPLTPAAKQQDGGPGNSLSNGSNGHANDSVYVTPDANGSYASGVQTSTPSSVLKKLASTRPEVGRSLENILNRVKSTPNVVDAERSTASSDSMMTPSVMTTSLSADKVGQTPANSDARLTQSFYVTPAEHFERSFNFSDASGGERTEYDVDGSVTKSQSHYARILSNKEMPEIGTAALASIPTPDSNANEPTPLNNWSSPNGRDLRGINASFFDHNDNVSGAAVTTPNGHNAERGSASDSDASSAVTVIHQKSPNDVLFLDDPFGSPNKGIGAFSNLMNDVSASGGSPSQTTVKTSFQQERPLMDL